MSIIFEWDEQKEKANQQKHGVSFQLAAHVFSDPFALSVQDRFENGEYRWQTIGSVGSDRIVLVAHVNHYEDGTEIIRIISARKATKKERQNYDNS